MHRDSEHARLRVIFLTLLLLSAAVAAGGPLQVYFSSVFRCGRVTAAPQLQILWAFAAVQITLFLAAQYSARLSAPYRITQWLAVILCAYQVFLLAHAYPTTFLFLGLALAGSAGIALTMVGSGAIPTRNLGVAPLFSVLPYLAVLSTLLVVHWLVGAGLVAQLFLYRPAGPLTTVPLIFSLVVGAIIAVTGGWSFHRRNYQCLRNLDTSAFPPLIVLLLALLRSKYPDGSYDALLYKGTWPYQIAEWRTAGMAILDEFGLGSNFQEMFNGFLLIVAPDYTPSLISTLSIAALFLVLPCSINLANLSHGLSRLMFGFASAVIISLTEVATAHGTAYQEPFIILLLTLGLLNAGTWPIFLSAAIATKLTAIFAVPLIFVYKFVPTNQSVVAHLWRRRLAILAAIISIGLFLWPQIDRNLIYSGRVFGRTETLATWTDPAGQQSVLVPGEATLFRPMPRGGLWKNLVLSTCNAFALDLFCPTAYQHDEDAGFLVFPSSRAFLVGILLALTAISVTALSRVRSTPAVLGSLAFLVCYLAFLSMATIGRFFGVPSFMLAVLVLTVCRLWSNAWASPLKGRTAILLVGLLAVVPVGDLLAGTFANHGWECRRELHKQAGTYGLNRPLDDPRYGLGLAEENFLQNLAARYRKSCPPPGLPPTVLVAGYGEEWLLPYLGMHVARPEMLDRFFDVDAKRAKNIPLAIAAVVVDDPAQLDDLTRGESSEFAECFKGEDKQIFCSNKLAPRGQECAHSVYKGHASFDSPGLAWIVLSFMSDRAQSIDLVVPGPPNKGN